jgi:hypothetical protein
MSFRISKSYERPFKRQRSIDTPTQPQEEVVFYIDEETGEIREERNELKVDPSEMKTQLHQSQLQSQPQPKSGQNMGLSISKKTVESWM